MITLEDLCMNTWYNQEVIVCDEDGNIFFEGENYKLCSPPLKRFFIRNVKSIGVEDGKLLIALR